MMQSVSYNNSTIYEIVLIFGFTRRNSASCIISIYKRTGTTKSPLIRTTNLQELNMTLVWNGNIWETDWQHDNYSSHKAQLWQSRVRSEGVALFHKRQPTIHPSDDPWWTTMFAELTVHRSAAATLPRRSTSAYALPRHTYYYSPLF